MDWFRHDSTANLDEKLQEVLLDYGLEGYGLYWYCLELIVGKVSTDNITFQLKHDARIIARNTGSTPQKVEEMMKRFVDIGLFENTDGMITCMKVAKRLMTSGTSNPQMRTMIQNIKSNQLVEDTSRHRHDDVTPDKIRLDKIREDKINTYAPPIPAELLSEWKRHRKNKPVTERVVKTIEAEANKLGWTLTQAIEHCCANSWQGFKAEWINKTSKSDDRQSVTQAAFGNLLNRYAITEKEVF